MWLDDDFLLFHIFDLHLPAHVAAFSTDAKMCLIIGAIFCLYWYFITYKQELKMLKHCEQVNSSMLSIIVMGAAMKYYLGHATFKNRFQTSLMLSTIVTGF